MTSFTYVITDKAGIHARPAGMVVKEAQKFTSEITVKAGGGSADAKKLMQLMSLGIRFGDEITVEASGEDEAAAWCELYGEYFVLSGELRILDRVSEPSLLEGQGLFELRLPEIDSAIVGRRIEFASESDDEYVTAYLDAVIGSVLYPRITALDLRDKFDLKLICDDLYLVELADGEDLPTKLSATAGVLSQTEAFPEGTPAVIDMADPAVSSAVVSHNVDISLDA